MNFDSKVTIKIEDKYDINKKEKISEWKFSIFKVRGDVFMLTRIKQSDDEERLIDTLKAGVIRIDLSQQNLEIIPGKLLHYKRLEHIDLSNNKLVELSIDIKKWTNIKSIDLSNNSIQKIPAELGSLHTLKYFLFLQKNDIKIIPVSLGNLHQLEYLNLAHNQLIYLPNELGLLSQLRVLHLEYNQLLTVPCSLFRLKNLKEIHLNNNELTKLACLEIDEETSALEILNLSFNQLQTLSFSKRVVTYKNLKELYINNNELEELPIELLSFPALKYLDVRDNEGLKLPSWIDELEAKGCKIYK